MLIGMFAVGRRNKENLIMTWLHKSLEENKQVIFGAQCLYLCGRTDSISGLLFL